MKKQFLFLSLLLSALLTNSESGPEKLLRILSAIQPASGGLKTRLPETPGKATKESKGDPSGSDSDDSAPALGNPAGGPPPPPPMQRDADGKLILPPGAPKLPVPPSTGAPKRPAPPSTGSDNDLLAAIRGGAQLKKTPKQTAPRPVADSNSITFTVGNKDAFDQGIMGTLTLGVKRHSQIRETKYTIVENTENGVKTVTFTLTPGYKWTDINSATAEQINNDNDDDDDSDDDDDDDYALPTMTPEEIAEAERLRKDAEEAQLKADAEEQVAEKLRLEAIVAEEKIQSQEVRAWVTSIVQQATELLQKRKEPGTNPQFSQEQLVAFLQKLSTSKDHKVLFNGDLSSTLGGMKREEYKTFQAKVWEFAFSRFWEKIETITSPIVSEENVGDYLKIWLKRSNKIKHKSSPEPFKSMSLASYKEF
jgi:hypothetical protein